LAGDEITRDEALLKLNDRCGQVVEVILHTEAGGTVMSANGVLAHWRDEPQLRRGVEGFDPRQRDDILGLYVVGDAGVSLDVTQLDTARPMADGDREFGLAYDFGDGTTLTVEWGVHSTK